MGKNIDFILLSRRCQFLQRMAGNFKFQSYNLAEHQYNTLNLFLWIVEDLGLTPTVEQIKVVLNHDILELFTNDIPWPIKHLNKSTECSVEELEKVVAKNNMAVKNYTGERIKELLSEIDNNIYTAMKLADVLDLYLFVETEIELGNKQVEEILNNCKLIMFDIIMKNPQFKPYIQANER